MSALIAADHLLLTDDGLTEQGVGWAGRTSASSVFFSFTKLCNRCGCEIGAPNCAGCGVNAHGKTKQTDQSAGAVSQADLAGAGAGHGPEGLSVLPAVSRERFRSQFRSRRHHRRWRERRRQVDLAGRHRGAGRLRSSRRGKGYMPVDHSNAIDVSGADLSDALRASWLPKVTKGWFFRAESFFSVALSRLGRERWSGFPLALAR